MFKYYTSYALVLSGFTHLICCGLPFFLSLGSLFSNLIIYESSLLDFELLEVVEVFLFAFTTIIFLTLVSVEVYNNKIKCADDECCVEEECDSTKKVIRFNIILSTVLYVFNSSVFLSEIIF